MARRDPVHAGQGDQEQQLVEHEDRGLVVGDLAQVRMSPGNNGKNGHFGNGTSTGPYPCAGDVEIERAVPAGGDLLEARPTGGIVDRRQQHDDRDHAREQPRRHHARPRQHGTPRRQVAFSHRHRDTVGEPDVMQTLPCRGVRWPADQEDLA